MGGQVSVRICLRSQPSDLEEVMFKLDPDDDSIELETGL